MPTNNWEEEFDRKFVKIDIAEMGKAVGMTLNGEILFQGKEKDIKAFIRFVRKQAYDEGYGKGISYKH